MIIKCPQCSTGYNIPEKLVADKPRKMRCTRCQNVFTIARRSEGAPRGYEEFTGRQHLPDEFAFLREAPQQQAPAVEPPPAEKPPEGLYESVAGAAADQTDTIPLEPRVVSGPTREPAPPATPAAPPAEPAPPTAQPAPPATPPPPAVQPTPPAAPLTAAAEQAPRSSSTSDIYGASSAWEMEAPLELGGYAIADEAPAEGGTVQTVGKVMTAIVALVVIFFVFVAWRNGWSIALSDLPSQMAYAFTGEGGEAIADEARDIEVTVSSRRLVTANDNARYLVVTGTVFNGDTVGRSEVVLRGRLLDLVGEVRDEARGPCGKVIEDEAIKATAMGAIGGHFREGGTLHNCTIKPEGDNVFQLIFEDMPLDYSQDFTVEVKAVAASAYLPG